MSSAVKENASETRVWKPRRAKDALKGRLGKTPEALFDVFWRDGELALLFGEPGSGKSLLAVQVADSLTRGIDPMAVALGKTHGPKVKKRRKVLYIDLVLTEKQFAERYFGCKFLGELIRDKPLAAENLFEFVAMMVTRYWIRTVIIDDLSRVSPTEDGTKDSLRLMNDLRQLTIETGVSILVLADSYPFVYEKQSPERGLRRSRVLCGVADSVFALHRDRIVQTRSNSSEKVWVEGHGLRYRIDELANGMPGLLVEMPESTDLEHDLIVDIKRMHDAEGMSFRQIARELEDISKSEVHRLYKQWTPEIEEEITKELDEDRRREEHQADLEAWKASGGEVKFSWEQAQFVKVPKSEDPSPDPNIDLDDEDDDIDEDAEANERYGFDVSSG